MVAKSTLKYIRSLGAKKYRNEYGVFVAEGNKLVADMLPAFTGEVIIARTSWMANQGNIPTKELLEAGEGDIRRASSLKNPQDVIAVFKQPDWKLEEVNPGMQLTLALDGVQDPGNLGTIVRLAGWFGIGHIVCSRDTADVFNPKVVQATMGALANVKVHYTDLEVYLRAQKEASVPVYGAFLEGGDIYSEELSATGIVVMGNEGNGIRPPLEAFIGKRLFIPNYPAEKETSGSLNVAVAAGIICSEFRRRPVAG